jgi:hypothetical protein
VTGSSYNTPALAVSSTRVLTMAVSGAKKDTGSEAPGPWLGIKRDLEDMPVSSLMLERDDLLCLPSGGLIEA